MNIIKKIKHMIRYHFTGEMSTNLLIERGLKVGNHFKRLPGCIIDESHCWLISIGDYVTLAPRVHILAHDASTKDSLNYTKIGLVTIGNHVFIGAGSIILPGITIGDNVIIGAGSVVTKNIPSGKVVAGNPAQIITNVSDYIDRYRALIATNPTYDEN